MIYITLMQGDKERRAREEGREGKRERGVEAEKRWMLMLFSLGMTQGTKKKTPTRDQNNLLYSTEMHSNKVLFTCIQIESPLKVKPI